MSRVVVLGLLIVLIVAHVIAQGSPQEMVGCPQPVRCPPGTTMQMRKTHKPSSNGCGSGGISIGGQFDMSDCCNAHDICYDTCGNNKEKCDAAFQKCMTQFCALVPSSKRSSCTQQAGLYSMGTSAFGCRSYQEAQKTACECVPRQEL